jgi:hypothetical protein
MRWLAAAPQTLETGNLGGDPPNLSLRLLQPRQLHLAYIDSNTSNHQCSLGKHKSINGAAKLTHLL